MNEMKRGIKRVGALLLVVAVILTMLPPVYSHAEESVDTTKPVIEKVEFPQQGMTLTKGSKVQLFIYAHDAQSGIEGVDVVLMHESEGNLEQDRVSVYTYYDQERKCYVAEATIGAAGPGKVSVSSINAVDKFSNYTEWDVGTEGKYKYWFTIENEDENINITEFNFPLDGKIVTEDEIDTILADMEMKLDTEQEYGEIYLQFDMGNNRSFICVLPYDSATGKYKYDYSSLSGIMDMVGEQKYSLSEIYVNRFGGQMNLSIDNIPKYEFTIQFPEEVVRDEERPKIISFEMEPNGGTLYPGDKVKLAIKATDNIELMETAVVGFSTTADIHVPYMNAYLEYNPNDQTYYGTLDITENTYPSEWYVDSVLIEDTSYHSADITEFNSRFHETYPYFINVYNDDTFVEVPQNVTINFMTKDENGSWVTSEIIQKENVGRRVTFKELDVTLPELQSGSGDFVQTGWMDSSGYDITQDTVFCNNGSINIYAKYDKNTMTVSYKYPGNDGTWKYIRKPQAIEKGTTYGQAIEKAIMYNPEDMTSEYPFKEWVYTLSDIMYFDAVIPDAEIFTMEFTATFSGGVAVGVSKNYYDENGRNHAAKPSEMVFVEEGTTYKKMQESLMQQDMPDMYPGLRFKEWRFGGNPNGVLKAGNVVYMSAIYENRLIRYFIDPRFSQDSTTWPTSDFDVEAIFCEVAETGQTVTLPKSFNGYGDITWVKKLIEGDSFIVNEHMEFSGYSATENPPVPPTEPEQPENPLVPGQGIRLPESTVANVVALIKNAANGEDIRVEMGNATVIPKDILEAAKGKDVNMIFNMNGYAWTVNGKDIFASTLQDINLEIKFDTNQIPFSTIEQLAGENPVRQLSLAHNGEFGFKATLTMNIGNEHADKYGNLYYYDSAGKMVFVNAGKVNADGTLGLVFTHGSEYVVVISDKQMSQTMEPTEKIDKKKVGAVKTGDHLPILPFVGLILAVSVMISTIRIKSKR